MKTIIDYLDELKEKVGSDYKVAELLGVDRSAISNIRKRGAMSTDLAIKIAELLNEDKGKLLIASEIAKSKGNVRCEWEKLAVKFDKKLLTILLNFFQ